MQSNEGEHIIFGLRDTSGKSYIEGSAQVTTLPAKVDLTKSLKSSSGTQYTPFPPIKTQGSIGSCVAFSLVYYQYTYEANRLNQISSTSECNQYSTAYAYNYSNDGVNQGVNVGRTLDFLSQRGCVKLFEFPYYPYDTSLYNMQRWLNSSNESITAMRNALNTRINSWYFLYNENTGINGPNSPSLTNIKTLLASGKVLSSGIGYKFNAFEKTDYNNSKYQNYANGKNIEAYTNGQPIVFEVVQGDVGHQLTIVGYDDDVWVDLNNNGLVESGECGAFKVVNSRNSSDQYAVFWLLYDTLNASSAISDWSSDLPKQNIGSRDIAFSDTDNGKLFNRFFFMNVSNKDVLIVGQIKYNLTNRSHYTLKLAYDNIKSVSEIDCLTRLNGSTPINAKYELFDMTPLIQGTPTIQKLTTLTRWQVIMDPLLQILDWAILILIRVLIMMMRY